jgi:hypothetical protein
MIENCYIGRRSRFRRNRRQMLRMISRRPFKGRLARIGWSDFELGLRTPQCGISAATVRHWDWALAKAAAESTRRAEMVFMFGIFILLSEVGRYGRWVGDKSEGVEVKRELRYCLETKTNSHSMLSASEALPQTFIPSSRQSTRYPMAKDCYQS